MRKRKVVIHCFVILTLITALAACASIPARESTGEYVDDSVITTKVKSLIAQDDFLKLFQISVETYQGTVLLSGVVNSNNAVTKAVKIVKGVNGVKSIKTKLIVR